MGRSAREMDRVFYLHLTKFTVGIKGEQEQESSRVIMVISMSERKYKDS